MPVSAAPFLSRTVTGFTPATPANVLSGTTTVSSSTAGNYGIALGNSATVKLAFPIPLLGQEQAERLAPYEQYNQPKTHTLNQKSLTVYYSVAGAALTSITIGLYATSYTATGGKVTTLIAQAANGLPTGIGTYAATVSLVNLSAPIPVSLLVAELDIATAGGGTAVFNGISTS